MGILRSHLNFSSSSPNILRVMIILSSFYFLHEQVANGFISDKISILFMQSHFLVPTMNIQPKKR